MALCAVNKVNKTELKKSTSKSNDRRKVKNGVW